MRPSILVVEDEDALREVVSELLETHGYRVLAARSGDEAALLVAEGATVDVLFTDVRMPGALEGVDVAIHARGRHPAIHVLVVSGYAPHPMARLGVLEPAAHFMSKP